MAAAPAVGSFPSPYEVETPAGCEGWEDMYPYYALLRRGAARGGRAALLVLELDALPGADAGVRRDLHRHRLPGARHVAEPRLRRAAGDGHRLALHQRLHLHLRQPGHRPREDRRARRVLPAARRLLLRELGRALREVADEDGGADRGARRAARCRSSTSTSPTTSRSATRRRATAPSSTPTGARCGSTT